MLLLLNPPSAIVNGGDNYNQLLASDMASLGVATTIEAASYANGSTSSTDLAMPRSDVLRTLGTSAAYEQEVREDEAEADSALSSRGPFGGWQSSHNVQVQGDAPASGRCSDGVGGAKADSGAIYTARLYEEAEPG